MTHKLDFLVKIELEESISNLREEAYIGQTQSVKDSSFKTGYADSLNIGTRTNLIINT